MTWKDLISESGLSFGFVNGQGLGSFLLAMVLIIFISRRPDSYAFFGQIAKHIANLIFRRG